MGDQTSYTAGHFELTIDGHPTTAYLKTLDGGYVRSSPMSEPIGPDNMQIKHTSVVDIEPFSADFGISGAQGVLQWIQDSWKKQFSRRNGQITHANFDLDQVFTHEFNDALITETTFPTLDGSSTDAAYLKLKFQPENVNSQKQDGGKLQSNLGMKQKMWLCSRFRLNIDGLTGVEYTNKLESFTIKQSIKKFYTGYDRFPTVEPTRLEFPNLNGTIGLGYADDLIGWYDDYVVSGDADPSAQKTGSIEFLPPDSDSPIFRLNLFEVGLHHLSIVPAAANAPQIKRVKFELFVGRMELDTGSGFDG